jgi:hypothetical protein
MKKPADTGPIRKVSVNEVSIPEAKVSSHEIKKLEDEVKLLKIELRNREQISSRPNNNVVFRSLLKSLDRAKIVVDFLHKKEEEQ